MPDKVGSIDVEAVLASRFGGELFNLYTLRGERPHQFWFSGRRYIALKMIEAMLAAEAELVKSERARAEGQ